MSAKGYEVKSNTVLIGENSFEIQSLINRNQYADPENIAQKAGISPASWPLFGIIWPSGVMLADYINNYPLENLRMLEIGCGLGLASMVAHKRGADITASDHHPMAKVFLDENISRNKLKPIHFQQIDWNKVDMDLGRFNFIIGSDVLYEPSHPKMIARFIERHAANDIKVVIVDPGRKQRAAFSRCMLENGFTLIPHFINIILAVKIGFTGKVLVYERNEKTKDIN